MTGNRPPKKAPAKAGALTPKKKLVDRAMVRFEFSGGPSFISPVDILVQEIRQWALLAQTSDDPCTRTDCEKRLREVATEAVQQRLVAMTSLVGGKKGGSSPKETDALQLGSSKRDAIIFEANQYAGSEPAKVAAIVRKTGASEQYVRRVLKET